MTEPCEIDEWRTFCNSSANALSGVSTPRIWKLAYVSLKEAIPFAQKRYKSPVINITTAVVSYVNLKFVVWYIIDPKRGPRACPSPIAEFNIPLRRFVEYSKSYSGWISLMDCIISCIGKIINGPRRNPEIRRAMHMTMRF